MNEPNDEDVYVSLANWLHWRGVAEKTPRIADAAKQVALSRALTAELLYAIETMVMSELRRLKSLELLREIPLAVGCVPDVAGSVKLFAKVSKGDAEAMAQAGYADQPTPA